MVRKVLVPLDGSTFSEAALAPALTLARRAGATVRLVSIFEPLTPPVYMEPLAVQEVPWGIPGRDSAGEYLDQVARVLAGAWSVPLETSTPSGPVAVTLEEEARDWGADLVVMTTHGRGPISRSWLGSVADDLVRHAPAPVLLIPSRDDEPAPDAAAERSFPNLILALDGSPESEAILHCAVEPAILGAEKVTLIRAVPLPFAIGSPYLPHSVQEDEALLEEERRQAGEYLGGIASRLEQGGLEVESEVPVETQPAVAIIEMARRRGADLIAMTTHGRTGFSRLLLGSVADKVVRGAHLPVLLCRPPTRGEG